MNQDERFMKEAIKEAYKAYKIDDVPIGAVIVKDNQIIARAYNKREKLQDATAHAEVLAIHKACKKLNRWRLDDCTIYVTLEPCPMCAGSMILSRMKRVVYGAYDSKGGSVESCLHMYDHNGFNHYPDYKGGVLEEECSQILKEYFKQKRNK
ncbi:MAG: tRNA adenosine(34) deaminase TadA [Erysipelotrichaceae bacterium]|nr:tRNA adenosine(34) deaminase TadA [Erysipelotrichaceae bacterium]